MAKNSEKAGAAEVQYGISVDIGTMNIVSARRTAQGVTTNRVRDAFLDLEPSHKKMLRLSGTSFVELDGRLLVIGDEALTCANLFNRDARRPMAGGILNPGETDAQQVIALMLKQVLGPPLKLGEKCCFSVPAAALDVVGSDVTYHSAVLSKILSELGYTGEAVNEAQAVVFSECAAESFSGIGVSYGSGMTNVCLSYNAMSALEFSTAKCLSEVFPVVTDKGVRRVIDVNRGDLVLGADGKFVEVISKASSGVREELVQLDVELMPAFPLCLTADHEVFVKSGFNWDWRSAGDLSVGDIVGVPIIRHDGNSGKSYYFGSHAGQEMKFSKSRNVGRFFGSFLGDGKSCVPSKGGYVELSLTEGDEDSILKYSEVLSLFGNVSVNTDRSKPGVSLVHVESKVLASHMDSFYGLDGEKIFPVPLCSVPDQMAVGILEGLFDTDGHLDGGRICFTTTSRSIVMVIHHLLNRFGVRHRVAERDPREGGINHLGKQIIGKKTVYEVRISDFLSNQLFHSLLVKEGHFPSGPLPQFSEYRLSNVKTIPYGKEVWDLTVASDHHSFSSPCCVVHNCGDWVDDGAAKAMNTTRGKMCALKESGINIAAPVGREQEAIGFYVQNLIEYSIKGIIDHFHRTKSEILVPKPIPIVVSGGTSLAGGFMDLFRSVFEKSRSRFPVEVSEVRAARDPMTAVATGLLVVASMDD